MAVSSKFSPRLPNVMSEANKMAKGKAKGTKVKIAYKRTPQAHPDLYLYQLIQQNVSTKTAYNKMKMQMKNVIKNSVKKLLNM